MLFSDIGNSRNRMLELRRNIGKLCHIRYEMRKYLRVEIPLTALLYKLDFWDNRLFLFFEIRQLDHCLQFFLLCGVM